MVMMLMDVDDDASDDTDHDDSDDVDNDIDNDGNDIVDDDNASDDNDSVTVPRHPVQAVPREGSGILMTVM